MITWFLTLESGGSSPLVMFNVSINNFFFLQHFFCQAGLALYWWQTLFTFSSGRIRVNQQYLPINFDLLASFYTLFYLPQTCLKLENSRYSVSKINMWLDQSINLYLIYSGMWNTSWRVNRAFFLEICGEYYITA